VLQNKKTQNTRHTHTFDEALQGITVWGTAIPVKMNNLLKKKRKKKDVVSGPGN